MLKRLIGPGSLILLCFALYWKLFTGQYTWLDDSDIANMEAPRLQFQAAQWHQGRFPLWDPHHWSGQPFLGQFTGAAYPLNWSVYLLPLHDGSIKQSTLHWYFVLLRIQAALFAYWLCCDLGRSRIASVFGGLVFAMSGFMAGAAWPQVFNGAVWAPAIFLFLLRSARGRDPLANAVLSGACLGMAWLSGHHEVPVYLSAALATAWLFFVLSKSARRRQMIVCAAASIAIAVLISGLQTVPGYEFGRLARRWAGVDEPLRWGQAVPYNVHSHYSLTPSSILGIIFPGMYDHVNPFLGVVAASLAVFAVVTRWRRLPVRFFAAIAALSLLLSMAAFNFVHGVLYSAAPLFGMARVPARMIVLFDFAAAPLAAFGLDTLLIRRTSPPARRLAFALAILATAVLGSAAVLRARHLEFDERFVLPGLTALLLVAAILASKRFNPAGIGSAVVLLTALEFGNVATYGWRNKSEAGFDSPWRRLQEVASIARFIRQQPGPVRVNYDDAVVPANIGDWYGIDTLQGYTAGVTSNIFRIGVHTERTQDLLGVNYAIGRKPSRADQVEMFEGEGGLRVYRNPGAFPRAWIVHEAIGVAVLDELNALLQNPAVDLRKKAPMLGEPPKLAACSGPEQVRFVARHSNEVILEVETQCSGMLVLADTWYPGWRAAVDGAPASIHEVYGALRGVEVPAGRHRVVMSYRPWSARIGAVMTVLGVISALAAAGLPRLRRQPVSRQLSAVADK